MNIIKILLSKLKHAFFRKEYPPHKLISNNIMQAGKESFHNGNFQAVGD
jgi:hypothetical protein